MFNAARLLLEFLGSQKDLSNMAAASVRDCSVEGLALAHEEGLQTFRVL